jgi:hypothetical protein
MSISVRVGLVTRDAVDALSIDRRQDRGGVGDDAQPCDVAPAGEEHVERASETEAVEAVECAGGRPAGPTLTADVNEQGHQDLPAAVVLLALVHAAHPSRRV